MRQSAELQRAVKENSRRGGRLLAPLQLLATIALDAPTAIPLRQPFTMQLQVAGVQVLVKVTMHALVGDCTTSTLASVHYRGDKPMQVLLHASTARPASVREG